MKKIINIIGARPQFIKYFPVRRAMENSSAFMEAFTEVLVHTGQHYDMSMSQIFFDELGLKTPDYNLGVGSGPHGEQTGAMLHKCEEVFQREKPDAVVVYGDTNSTLAAALSAIKLHIPVAHIEAGLRSFNKSMPEEVNRILTDDISTLLMCPSRAAIENMEKSGRQNIYNKGGLIPLEIEGRITAEPDSPAILNVGDVMYDVIALTSKAAEEKSVVLPRLALKEKSYRVLTIHRAESTDDDAALSEIIKFVNDNTIDSQVVFPMHPRTKKAYEKCGLRFTGNVRIIEPLGYFDMLKLLSCASMLMTDSGGMQKEAYWLKVPCVTLRDRTEWVETIESGWNILYRNYRGAHNILDAETRAYGDGRAAERIVSALTAAFG